MSVLALDAFMYTKFTAATSPISKKIVLERLLLEQNGELQIQKYECRLCNSKKGESPANTGQKAKTQLSVCPPL